MVFVEDLLRTITDGQLCCVKVPNALFADDFLEPFRLSHGLFSCIRAFHGLFAEILIISRLSVSQATNFAGVVC